MRGVKSAPRKQDATAVRSGRGARGGVAGGPAGAPARPAVGGWPRRGALGGAAEEGAAPAALGATEEFDNVPAGVVLAAVSANRVVPGEGIRVASAVI